MNRLIMAVIVVGAAFAIPSSANARSAPGYTLMILPSLGGDAGYAGGINAAGVIAGQADLSSEQAEHAVVWALGTRRIVDLGTLGGPNSAIELFHDGRGLLAGYSDTAQTDPNSEDFCGFGTDDICEAFMWRGHGLDAFGPLPGGNNSAADDVNDLGAVAGVAENGTQDPTCTPPEVLDYEAVIWGPKHGEVTQLPPYGEDPASSATSINDAGDVVGESGPCGEGQDFPTSYAHPLLWHDGQAMLLPTLGGSSYNLPFEINAEGEAAGYDATSLNAGPHAVLWPTPHVVKDLGLLSGYPATYAIGINDAGDVAGYASSSSGFAACIWIGGKISDLNALIQPSTGYFLVTAEGIDDRDDVVGEAMNTVTKATVAFVAVPTEKAPLHESVRRPVSLPPAVIRELERHGVRAPIPRHS